MLNADLNNDPEKRQTARVPDSSAETVFCPMPGWTPRRVAQATLTALGVGIAFFLLYRFYMVVFIFFVAVMLQIAMKPATVWLRKWGLRIELSVGLIYLLLLTCIMAFIWLAAPLLVEQTSTVAQQIPDYYEKWRTSMLESGTRLVRAIALALPPQLSPANFNAGASADEPALDAMTPVWQAIKTGSYVFFILTAVLMLAYYWTLEGDIATRRLLLFTKQEDRPQLRMLLTEIEDKIGGYFWGQTVLCVTVGALSIAGYLLIGLPYALGLGLLMGLLEAIPLIGPLLGAIPAILVALTTAPDKVLWVIGVVSIIQFLENNLLVPKIMDKSVGVHAIVTILAIAAFGVLLGLGGAILAIPLAAIMQILFNHFVLRVPSNEDIATAPTTVEVVGRNRVSSLRLEAQDLVDDLRKQARRSTYADAVNDETEQVEDLLEAIAGDLDALLSQMEETA